LDNPNDSEHDCEVGDVSDIEQHNDNEDLETVQQENVSADQNIASLIQPKCKSMTKTETGLLMCISMEKLRNR